MEIEKKRLCVRWLGVINLTWENLQIAKHKSVRWAERTSSWFVLCKIFSGKVYDPEPPRAQSLFLFPIVFGINLILFSMGRTMGRAEFDHLSWDFNHSSRGSRHSRESPSKEGNFFWQRKVWTHCEFQHHNGDHLRKELRQEVWREKRKVRIFGKGKCELTAIVRIFGMGRCINSSPILVRQWWRHFRLSLCISLSFFLRDKKIDRMVNMRQGRRAEDK